MTPSYNFRSAFNGFHREDVVHYIEYINSKHTTQLNQLRSDLAAVQQENQDLRATPAPSAELEDKADALEARVAELERELATAEQAWADLEKELAKVKQERDEALSAQAETKRRSDDELEAYRRAERVERQAKERTEVMYHRANGVIADATIKVDDAAAQIATLADQVVGQLAALQQAVTGSKRALSDAASSLYAIKPEE
ncbi:MAG: hypothetical protein IIV61_06815 [Oscillospiraceae bacterium]|nr:hypothetical protein [Oscillospiraceae bacterium]MBQ5712305.1 hypothetical protein [Oscillospiraceae bacterium]